MLSRKGQLENLSGWSAKTSEDLSRHNELRLFEGTSFRWIDASILPKRGGNAPRP